MNFLLTYSEYAAEWMPRLAEAALVTAELSAIGFGLAMLLGGVLSLSAKSRFEAIRWATSAFIQAMRVVPLLALLLAVYFALPSFGLTLSGCWAGALGLGLHGSAYVAEILRAGLGSVHRGQKESALAVGLPPYMVFLHVVMPQAMRVMLPPLLNSYVALLKDSSLCALIATNELMLTARAMASEYFLPLHIFVLVGAFYFAIAFPLSMLSRALSRRLSKGRRAIGMS